MCTIVLFTHAHARWCARSPPPPHSLDGNQRYPIAVEARSANGLSDDVRSEFPHKTLTERDGILSGFCGATPKRPPRYLSVTPPHLAYFFGQKRIKDDSENI